MTSLESLRQWWHWACFAWRYRDLAQCYQSAIMALGCAFRDEPPPPQGKVWRCEMWIDPELCGLGMHSMEDAETGEPVIEYEQVTEGEGTYSGGYGAASYTFRPKHLRGFASQEGA